MKNLESISKDLFMSLSSEEINLENVAIGGCGCVFTRWVGADGTSGSDEFDPRTGEVHYY